MSWGTTWWRYYPGAWVINASYGYRKNNRVVARGGAFPTRSNLQAGLGIASSPSGLLATTHKGLSIVESDKVVPFQSRDNRIPGCA